MAAACVVFPPEASPNASARGCELLALRTGSDAHAPYGEARVCRSVTGTGLHRQLETSISLDVPAAAVAGHRGAAVAAAGDAAPAHCELAVTHLLGAGVYFDLDEVRAALRTHARSAACAGSQARLFARAEAVDVERPGFESGEHVVTTVMSVAQGHGPGQWRGGGAPLHGGCMGAAVLRADDDRQPQQLRLTAVLRHTLHLRYPLPGCGGGGSSGGGGSGGRGGGGGVDVDASATRDPQPQPGDAAGGGSGVSGGDSASWWWTAPPGAMGWLGPAAGHDARMPYVSGCYSTPHLLLPAVHLHCALADGDAREPAPPLVLLFARGMRSGADSARIDMPTASGSASEAQSTLDGRQQQLRWWLQLAPLRAAGSEDTSSCAPPLFPVPAAPLAAAPGVLLATTLMTWLGALLVVVVVVRAKLAAAAAVVARQHAASRGAVPGLDAHGERRRAGEGERAKTA